MSSGNPETRPTRHPEIFWVLFTVASGAVLLAVVEPARREHDAAEIGRASCRERVSGIV